jgi:hypothetical protein
VRVLNMCVYTFNRSGETYNVNEKQSKIKRKK